MSEGSGEEFQHCNALFLDILTSLFSLVSFCIDGPPSVSSCCNKRHAGLSCHCSTTAPGLFCKALMCHSQPQLCSRLVSGMR